MLPIAFLAATAMGPPLGIAALIAGLILGNGALIWIAVLVMLAALAGLVVLRKVGRRGSVFFGLSNR